MADLSAPHTVTGTVLLHYCYKPHIQSRSTTEAAECQVEQGCIYLSHFQVCFQCSVLVAPDGMLHFLNTWLHLSAQQAVRPPPEALPYQSCSVCTAHCSTCERPIQDVHQLCIRGQLVRSWPCETALRAASETGITLKRLVGRQMLSSALECVDSRVSGRLT